MRFQVPEHPDIERCLRTGYPYEVDDDCWDDDDPWDNEDLEDYYD